MLDKIIISLPSYNDSDEKRSIKLVNYLLKDNVYKLFNSENIKFIIKPFNKETKTYFLNYNIFSAPTLYCKLNDMNEVVKLTNFKDIFNWLKKLKKTIENDKINSSKSGTASLSKFSNNLPKSLNEQHIPITNSVLDLDANEFMTKNLMKGHQEGAKFIDHDEEDSDEKLLQEQYAIEQNKRKNMVASLDPRMTQNTSELKTMQHFQEPLISSTAFKDPTLVSNFDYIQNL